MQVISLDFSDDDGSRSTVDDNADGQQSKSEIQKAELGESNSTKPGLMSKNTMNLLNKEMNNFKQNLQQLNTYFLQAEECVQALQKIQETSEIYIKLKDQQDQDDKQRRDVIKTGQIAVKAAYAILQQLTATLRTQKEAQEAEWETHPELQGTYTPAVAMQENLIRGAQKRFIAVSHCFSEAQVEARQMLQSKAKRLLQMVNKDVSDEVLEAALRGGATELLQDAALRHDAEAQQILEVAAEKYEQSARINDLTLELKEMSANLLTLLAHQSGAYDRVEEEVVRTRHNVQEGVGHLRAASEHARKAKCCICCAITLFVAVVLVVLLITLGVIKAK